MMLKKYKSILPIPAKGRSEYIQGYCCWVHEYEGYYAYCHKDGRLITRTGRGVPSSKTWSSVGVEVMCRVKANIKRVNDADNS